MLVSPLLAEDIDNFTGNVWRLSKDHNILKEPYLVGSKKFKSDDYSPLLEIVRQEGVEVKV